jgi:peptidoglycan/LPS O-acetylase OafA/YrhL
MTTFSPPGSTAQGTSAARFKRVVELPALTGLRFFAALFVVLYHFVSPAARASHAVGANLLSTGYMAVGVFFLLSGFVLTYSYLGEAGTLSTDRRSFWIARFARIYPAYLFAFLVAAPFQIVGSIYVNGWRLAAEKLAVGGGLYLSLLQSWTPWTAWYWNPPAWSLSVEVFFYFCFPFLGLLFGRMLPRRCLGWAVGLWMAGLLVPALYCALRVPAAQPLASSLQLAIETNPLLRLPEFLVGVLLGRIYLSGFRFSPRAAAALSLAVLVGLGAALSASAAIPRPLLANGLLVPLSALLIFSLAHQRGLVAALLSNRVVKLLGEASFSIYILQIPVSHLLGFTPERFTPLRFACYLALLTGISLFSFFYVEKPLRSRVKAMFEWRLGGPRGAATALPNLTPACGNAPLQGGHATVEV